MADARFTSLPRRRRAVSAAPSVLNSYRVRLMLALAVSLGLLWAATLLPIRLSPERVGWSEAPQSERQLIQHPELPDEAPSVGGAPVAVSDADGPGTDEGTSTPGRRDEPRDEPSPASDEPPPAEPVPIRQLMLSDSDRAPRVRGDMGSLYLRIGYPEAARGQGIEGRLIVEFTVGTDGRTRDVHVVDMLHPLCDSAAVAALQRTRFVPGRQRGEPVPVRMRLPVRFKLIGPVPNEPSVATSE